MIRRCLLLFGFAVLIAYLGPFGLANSADTQQPGAPWRIGVLLVGWSPEQKEVQEFRRGLLDAGYVEGRDVVIEWRLANGDYARAPELVADLVQRKVDVIVVDSTQAVRATVRATSAIPIVDVCHSNSYGVGLRSSRSRPSRKPRASGRKRHWTLDDASRA